MREIQASAITRTIADLCQRANFKLGKDVIAALEKARQKEKSPVGPGPC